MTTAMRLSGEGMWFVWHATMMDSEAANSLEIDGGQSKQVGWATTQ
jgi:hypothetical protein